MSWAGTTNKSKPSTSSWWRWMGSKPIKGSSSWPPPTGRKSSILPCRPPGFVGADLANLVNEAALLAARKNKEVVGPADFDEAIDRVVGGLQKKNRVMNPQEKEIVAFHESGHAIVAESVEHGEPVHKISIIPRGIAALGYTEQQPTDERYLMTRSELLDRLAVLLGGGGAEELGLGEKYTGGRKER